MNLSHEDSRPRLFASNWLCLWALVSSPLGGPCERNKQLWFHQNVKINVTLQISCKYRWLKEQYTKFNHLVRLRPTPPPALNNHSASIDSKRQSMSLCSMSSEKASVTGQVNCCASSSLFWFVFWKIYFRLWFLVATLSLALASVLIFQCHVHKIKPVTSNV